MAEEKDAFKSTTSSLRDARKQYISPWGIVERTWGFHNERIESYEDSFVNVLSGKSIADLIKNRSNPVVIDLMGAPFTIHDLLTQFPTGRGLAVSLQDHKIDYLRDDIQKTYQLERVKWLAGDITHSNTWREIEQWLD